MLKKDCFRIIAKDGNDWITDEYGDYVEFEDKRDAEDYIEDSLDGDLEDYNIEFIKSDW